MELWQITSLALGGLSLAFLATIGYVVLRYSAWTPGGGSPVASARMHGMVTALIALFATGTASVSSLYRLDGTSSHDTGTTYDDGFGEIPSSTVHQIPIDPLQPWAALLVVASAAFWLLAIYAIAQYTWPRPTGQVRTARLAPRSTQQYLPRALSGLVGIILLTAVGTAVLAWSTPGSPALAIQQVDDFGDGGYSRQQWVQNGFRAGTEFAPWLLVGIVLTAAATVLALQVITRRPPLAGLTTADDDAVRRITINRALRTVGVIGIGFLTHGAQAWAFGVKEAAIRSTTSGLTDWLTGHPEYENSWQSAVPGPAWWLDTATPGLGLALILVLLFWRSSALAALGSTAQPGDFPDGGTTRLRPARPGTLTALLRLRRDNLALAVFLGTLTLVAVLGPTLFTVPVLSVAPWLMIVVAAVPGLVVLAVFCTTEVQVRRLHAARPSDATPVLEGRSSRWRWIVLAVAVAAGLAVAAILLTGPMAWPAMGWGLLASIAVLTGLTVAASRLALRRPALTDSTAANDQYARTHGADRLIGAGTAALFFALTAALQYAAPTWGNSATWILLALGVASALWPGPSYPGARADVPAPDSPAPHTSPDKATF